MSIFRVYVDGQLFYHPHLSQLALMECKVSEDAENIDSLTLSAPFNHPYIGSIRPMASVIVCKKGETVVFEGRALDDGTDFYNTHTWTCESCLSYLKDTVQPPFEYSGTFRGLLELFLSRHNAAVEENKQFAIGNITVTDNNDYITRSNVEYSTTMDAIREKLLSPCGGYLQARFENGVRYLDYLSDFNTRSLQTVEYGKNLMGVKITRDHTERVTALIPLGARKTETDEEGNETETDEHVDIASVNDGKNYVCDMDAVKEIGWIWRTEVWEDVTLPANLLRKANMRLSELSQGITSMELTIIDESDTGADIGDIRARMYVRCVSKPHGIDGTYLCLSRTVDYLHPAGNTITIGAANVKLTSISVKQNQNLTALQESIEGQDSKIETAVSQAKDAKKSAEILKIQVHESYSEIAKTAEEIISTVHDTYLEKSELETIQRDFQSSITQNSSEIRMDFTAVTDEIKNNVAANQELLEEYIRFRGALIELGKVGNAFTAELSNEQLAFKENGQTIAYISNQSLVITNAEIRYKLSLGNEERGWFDFIPRSTGNLSIKWRGPSS